MRKNKIINPNVNIKSLPVIIYLRNKKNPLFILIFLYSEFKGLKGETPIFINNF